MTRSATVHFTKEQIEYLMDKLDADDPDDALEVLARIMKIENIDPSKMPLYLKKLMSLEGQTK